MSIINFDSNGTWDIKKHEGPAIHAPDDVKAIITKYHIKCNLCDIPMVQE